MGSALAYRLLAGGHGLTVWNRSAGKADELVESGARLAASPVEAVGGVEVVLTNLADDGAVREVVLGDGGIAPALGERTYADTSTISPALSRRLNEALPRFVGMPVLGAPHAVRAGEATYLAGGSEELIDGLQPLLDSLGGRVRRYARPELAAAAKLAVNLMLLAGLTALAESFAVGRAGGLSDAELAELLGEAPVVAPALRNRFEAVLKASGPAWWTTLLAAKDARLAVETAGAAGKDLPLASVVRDLYQAAADSGFADQDMVAVARLYE
jgi:3-hydroxyisobutyrate dehydrogenase-like beta-hydroxyacid dehydrogenase